MTDEFGSSEAGRKGGKARADKLTKAQRREIAKQAAAARWAGGGGGRAGIPVATHGSPDNPLMIGDIPIPCYVLEDDRRVIVQAGLITALGMTKGGSSHRGGTRLAKFVAQDRINPFCREGLVAVTSEPVKFLTRSGTIAFGFEATILADICDAVLAARKAGKLTGRQTHIAERCEILMRSFARVGIIALVDEATGYQRDRARDDLARILEAFVAKEIQKWLRTFELEFYELMCDLRNEPLERAKKRPAYFGKLTNNLVYQRLAPGVLQKLREVNPITEAGRRKHMHHQYLTPDLGHPKLKEHLAGVTTAMKFAKLQNLSWDAFMKMLDKTHPRYNPMPLFDHLPSND